MGKLERNIKPYFKRMIVLFYRYNRGRVVDKSVGTKYTYGRRNIVFKVDSPTIARFLKSTIRSSLMNGSSGKLPFLTYSKFITER